VRSGRDGFLKFCEESFYCALDSDALRGGGFRQSFRRNAFTNPRTELVEFCNNCLGRRPFPLAGGLTPEFSLKRS
jgi:hypothetical protein